MLVDDTVLSLCSADLFSVDLLYVTLIYMAVWCWCDYVGDGELRFLLDAA